MGETSDDDAILFARAAIGSVSALELLLLLRRHPHKRYSLDELVRELRSSRIAVTRGVEHLMRFGLVEEAPESGYRYQQGSQQLDALCQQLQSVHARKPVTLIRAILEAPDEKLRAFANAFRISEKNK